MRFLCPLSITLLGWGLAESSSFPSTSLESDRFTEKLLINPLTTDKVLAHFDFTITSRWHTPEGQEPHHYRLFPRLIGQIIEKFGIREFHLSIGQGRWDYDSWGYPVEPSTSPSLELWTRLETGDDMEDRWQGFTNALSGLFCASLNFVDNTTTSSPLLSFRSPSQLQKLLQDKAEHPTTPEATSPTPSELRHTFLAREGVCTENLTPWIKLLPCQAKSGLTTLLNTYRLFDSSYHSMSIHVHRTCLGESCSKEVWRMRQTLTTVTDRLRLPRQSPALLDTLFDRSLKNTCPLADQSTISVLVPTEGNTFTLQSKPSSWSKAIPIPERKVALFDLKSLVTPNQSFDIDITWPNTWDAHGLSRSSIPLVMHRYVTGQGLERNGLEVHLENRHTQDIPVVYLDTLPWYLNVYFHTLRLEAQPLSAAQQPQVLARANTTTVEPTEMYLQPSHDHGRPAVMEIRFTIPAQSLVTLSVDFDKMFLKYTEHPPDANRGLNVGSAILTAALVSPSTVTPCDYQGLLHPEEQLWRHVRTTTESATVPEVCLTRLYSELFLVSLPTPDFSMPYNVIAFTCTVLAFFFGSMFNSLSRGYVVLSREDVQNTTESPGTAGNTSQKNGDTPVSKSDQKKSQ
ncbi:Subunit of the glycosylphosphatidylinositol transamidase complex-like protein [Dispira parvispora]|uniref:Subunit of the glycosylphosphatidylinositol transamidase complex-like protein n=1 Tax=Dispira parvispora TaxID=1520584 RepID=A0A9W8AVB7_9FUNG|nr:Subunit of the glycosylphosphatidylinositol transamidase complex-like protein [Dispira parvispora]